MESVKEAAAVVVAKSAVTFSITTVGITTHSIMSLDTYA
jgi:hypothetical protein